MGKISVRDYSKYEDEYPVEHFKKTKKKNVKKKREKEDKRKNYVDFSQLNWEGDEDS